MRVECLAEVVAMSKTQERMREDEGWHGEGRRGGSARGRARRRRGKTDLAVSEAVLGAPLGVLNGEGRLVNLPLPQSVRSALHHTCTSARHKWHTREEAAAASHAGSKRKKKLRAPFRRTSQCQWPSSWPRFPTERRCCNDPQARLRDSRNSHVSARQFVRGRGGGLQCVLRWKENVREMMWKWAQGFSLTLPRQPNRTARATRGA
eukprot:1643314-Rhodomonas_salina.2